MQRPTGGGGVSAAAVSAAGPIDAAAAAAIVRLGAVFSRTHDVPRPASRRFVPTAPSILGRCHRALARRRTNRGAHPPTTSVQVHTRLVVGHH